MTDQKFQQYFNSFEQPTASMWWPKAIAVCSGLGGLYGASLGSAVGAVPGGTDVILVATSLLAVMCGIAGSRYGFFFGMVNRVRFGPQFGGAVGGIGGAIIGGFLATMVLLALGAILGALTGWFFMQAILTVQRGLLARFLGGIVGVFLGTFLGAIAWAIRLNQSGATVSATWGLGIGAIVGPLLLLWFVVTLRSLLQSRRVGGDERGNVIDATFSNEK